MTVGFSVHIFGMAILRACQYAISNSSNMSCDTICFILIWKGVVTMSESLFLASQNISKKCEINYILTVIRHAFECLFNFL